MNRLCNLYMTASADHRAGGLTPAARYVITRQRLSAIAAQSRRYRYPDPRSPTYRPAMPAVYTTTRTAGSGDQVTVTSLVITR
jgi:hypothetical protein